ncbi:uncharacterized protein LOC130893178 isoform X1 [Diorhabda carinulata]|uniref:uncharacterized protein LOC130893178 isoform X1 n=1 Tax=Diorhabda carinulata TaxID=1163345 RepID=UPI0025A2D8A9|nr:uncharacterized protein LOC130893178 isoform X1 [Diorhabda carinulata]XP_057655042.1 uncharacterized protein LOC130893178 isoform X1 [Diorhabda carinulata]XP_057655043.1 uncharacterized protein LOC130893178 isoform X1 [Diorhabda carinulata]
MSDFDLIQAGFNNADETINFGTRSIGCATASLFEICTLGLFKSEDESFTGVTDININAVIKNGYLFFAIDDILKIFQDVEMSQLIFNATLQFSIRSITISSNGQFFLICFVTGDVELFTIGEEGIETIHSESASENSHSQNAHVVACSKDDELAAFLIVYHNGNISRITVHSNNSENKFNVVTECLCKLDCRISLSDLVYPHLITDGFLTSNFNLETKEVATQDSYNFKKMYYLGQMVLCLDFEGNSMLLCPLTLTIFFIDYDFLIEDMLVMKNENPKILVVTKPNEIGDFFLQLLESDFRQIFSLKINYPVEFVQMDFAKNDIVFISKITTENKITELRIQTVYETDPESRLMRLIKRRRFEEAELFAKTFNVNPTIILKAKAQLIVDKTKCTSEDIDDLINLMNDINDSWFNLQCCTDVDCSNFQDVRKILTYGSKITPTSDDENKEELLEMKGTKLDLLYKFDTFMALTGESNIQSWTNFSLCNLLLEVKEYLKNYRIQDAIIVYSRLDDKAKSSLNEEHVRDILEIFNNLPWDLVQPFLPTFIPITMTYLPSALFLFVNWLLDKIYHMEKRDSVNFPENSIVMVEDIMKMINVPKKNCISFQRHCIANRGFEDLSGIIEGLKILRTLKNKFGICVKLNEYLEGPNALTSTLVQLSMPPDQYENFLKNFLYTFMLQNNIDPDTVFVKEINTLIEFGESWITAIEVILKHVSCIEMRLLTVKNILEKTPVPWCDVTRRITQNVLQLKHPLVIEIAETFNNESRLIVLRNNRYGIRKTQLANEFGNVIHRIIYVNKQQRQMIEDIYQLCQSDKERCQASVILLQHLISNGHLDEAGLVFHKYIQKEAYECAKTLTYYAEAFINEKDFNSKTQENYYNMLPKLYNILIESTKMEYEKQMFQEDHRLLRGVYYFKNELQCHFTTHSFKSSVTKKEKYEELIKMFAEKINSESCKFSDVLKYSEKVAYHLSKDKDEVLVKFCEQIKNFEFILKAGEHLYDTNADSKNLCLISGLFIQFLGYNGISAFEPSLLENTCNQTLATFDNLKYEDDSYKNDIFINGLILAEKILTKARMTATYSDILMVDELSRWINCCYYLTRQDSTLYDELYKNIYCPKANIPSNTVLDTVRNCFEAFVLTLEKRKFAESDYFTYFSKPSEAQMAQLVLEINSLPSTMDIFCREGQYLTAFFLLRTLSNSLYLHPIKDQSILKPLHSLMSTKIPAQIIYAVVSAKYIDLDLLYNLLLSARKEATKYLCHYLQTYKRNCKKFHDLSLVGIRLSNFYKDPKGRDVMVNSVKTCKWWRALTPYHSKMIYDEFFKSDADARLKYLINLELLGTKEIRNYCEDFKLNVNQYFKEFLRSSLINWKPDYEIQISNGKRQLIIKNDPELLHSTCEDIIKEIEEKEKAGIFVSMEKMIKEINFYHYEVFLTIYKMIEQYQKVSNDKFIEMLLFLKKYTRFEAPSQREKEEWYITFPDTQILDPLSEFRLPFTTILFTMDIWSILRPEISLKSYEIWFQATTILRKNLKNDDICVYAVKQVVSSGILGNNPSNNWTLYSKFEDLFHEVDKCIQHISDLERATSAAYHLMNYTPDGADKVLAAKLSFKYASIYRNNHLNDPEVERAYLKVKNKFYGLSVCSILHRYNLAKETYLKLVTQPQCLIESLYMDESIPKYAGTFCLAYSDINNAVDALAELFNLDIEEIRLDILNRWLSSSYMESDMDTTLYFTPIVSNNANNNIEEDNLKRAVYLCSSGDQQTWRTYLLRVGLNEVEDEHKNVAFKARALKCFCALTDEITITELTKLPYNEFLNYIDKLTLLSELETLSIFLNIETLQQYNKRELLKKLSVMGKPLAIKCMGDICITYFLQEDKYWEYIVNSSIKLEMIEELKIYVEFLKDKCDKYYYIRAWQALVDKSFQQIPNDDQLEQTLINNFLMIQSCPVSFSLNYEKIIQNCINLGKNEYAVLLLQYIPEEKRKLFQNSIFKCQNLCSNLDNLEKKGLWGTRNFKNELQIFNMCE